jgi:microcystin-dependent protein
VTGSTSESGEHNHTVTTLGANFGVFGGSGGSNAGNTTRTTSLGGLHAHTISGTAAATGGGSAHENRPPYYALAYIMKL